MNVIKVVICSTRSKREPFSEWEGTLDIMARAIINQRLDRIKKGNLGNTKNIKGSRGIWEFRIQYGPGYRIYFGKQRNTVIVLLVGGKKANQNKDIEKAKQYWLDYKERS